MLQGIWQRNWLTNSGPLVNELEVKLKERLGVEHLLYLGNGTIAIQLAIKALRLSGEIITTPFSYVATTSAIVWEGCTPVFADIDPDTLTIDPNQIEKAITPRTVAILATHVYGNPCDIDAIQAVADRHGLKVIYDAAHAFGTTYKGRSVFEYGDISTASFHATKIFHTIEGGAVIAREEQVNRTLSFMRNFGHDGPGKFAEVGINGKNSEFHAAMGLVNLGYMEEILSKRKMLCHLYDKLLAPLGWGRPRCLPEGVSNNSYFAIIPPSEKITIEIEGRLQKNDIFPRRYFYPGLNGLGYVKGVQLPVSDSISERVLCLPLYHSLSTQDVERVSEIILQSK